MQSLQRLSTRSSSAGVPHRPPPRSIAVGLVLAALVLAVPSFRSLAQPQAAGESESPSDRNDGTAGTAGAPGAADTARASRPAPIFFLRDGSKVAGFPTFDAIAVATKYGVLHVPADELLRIRLVARVDDELARTIATEIERLGSSDFDEREGAMDRIRALGAPALPAVQQAIASENDETRNRAEILVEEIRSNLEQSASGHGEEMPAALGDADEIIARRFKIKGHVQEAKFTVRSRFGDLEFRAADVLGIDFRIGSDLDESFTVPANRSVPANWLDTKASAEKGQRLTIRASGNLQVSNYSLTVGPDGTTRYGASGVENFPMLSLVGQIGKKGKPFLIGPAFRGRASASGTLYLGVVPFRRNYAATGSFKVDVESD